MESPGKQANRHQWSSHFQQTGQYRPRFEMGDKKRDLHNAALGRAIRQLRQEAGVTQQELAIKTQMSVREVRRIEHGDVEADWGTIRHLAGAMRVKLVDIFRLTEELER